ncbi:hypothetical protein [Streptomyces sp. STR69]|uniref:hypothetical protein n=1 Tax=Streptomyces sp. STR69 TaxID=1796942 RepID=UPI0021C87407|nr:hypothetical protein [Streptomyces sp. STR69]
MRALATRPQRLALGIAVLSAAALGTTAAQASGATTTAPRTTVVSGAESGSGAGVTTAKGSGGTHFASPRHVAFAVAYHPTSNAPGDLNTANGDFAACMRKQGQTVFPGFHAAKDSAGHVSLQVKVGKGDFDPTTAGYKKAVATCGPILEKAGITFPDPADLPALPTPGKAGKPGKPGKVTSELPSLTRAFEQA